MPTTRTWEFTKHESKTPMNTIFQNFVFASLDHENIYYLFHFYELGSQKQYFYIIKTEYSNLQKNWYRL